MAERRDYYEVLGVARDADADTIKAAFRELALRYHPDRSQESDSEERFKEIAEAYAVLGNEKKRAQYDAGGFGGVSDIRPEDLFSGADFQDLFGGLGFEGLGGGGLFDRLFGGLHRRSTQGAPVEVRVRIPLEMVVSGGEQRVSVGHPRTCSDCSGSGAASGTEPRSCAPCGGTGQRTSTSQQGNVRMQTVTTCSSCQGRGRFIDDPCASCGGSGEVSEGESLTVRIPVGAEEGMVLRVPGKGMPPPVAGASPGDLLVVVETLSDPRFTRRGAHLWREEELPLVDAVLGASLRVPTLTGHASVKVPPGSQPDTVMRLRGKGLPELGSERRGDLYVALRLRVPDELSREQRKLWKQLKALESTSVESDVEGS
ncbi:MAG: DnaJ C-terminal domain-containing protein [Planctomycetota bacterium]|jgi:molecular chaperone DnaJ